MVSRVLAWETPVVGSLFLDTGKVLALVAQPHVELRNHGLIPTCPLDVNPASRKSLMCHIAEASFLLISGSRRPLNDENIWPDGERRVREFFVLAGPVGALGLCRRSKLPFVKLSGCAFCV